MDNVEAWTTGSYIGSLVSIFAGLTFENILALGGFIILVSTFLMNRHYRKKADLRDAAEEIRKAERHEWARHHAKLAIKHNNSTKAL